MRGGLNEEDKPGGFWGPFVLGVLLGVLSVFSLLATLHDYILGIPR